MKTNRPVRAGAHRAWKTAVLSIIRWLTGWINKKSVRLRKIEIKRITTDGEVKK